MLQGETGTIPTAFEAIPMQVTSKVGASRGMKMYPRKEIVVPRDRRELE